MPLVLPSRRSVRQGTHLALAVAALLAGVRAHSDIRFYSNKTDFQKAAGNLFSIGFEGVAPANGIQDYGVGGSAGFNSPIFFQAVNGALSVADGNYYQATTGTPFNLGSGAFLQVTGGSPAQLFVAGNGGLYAGGFDLSTGETNPASQVQITLGNLASVNVVAPQNAPAFLGFISTEAVSSLMFTDVAGSQNSKLFLDNLQYSFSPVPEMPVPVGLAVIGTCSLLAWRRARLRSASGSK